MHSATLFRFLAIFSSSLVLLVVLPLRGGGTEPVFDHAQLVGPRGELELIDLLSGRDGGVLLAYRTSHQLSGLPNPLIKVNAEGMAIWTNRSLPRIEQIASDPRGNLYVIGSRMYLTSTGEFTATDWFTRRNIPTEGSGTAYVAKLSSAGDLLWVRLFGQSLRIEGLALTLDQEGNYYAGGQYRGGGAQIENVVLPVANSGESGVYVAKFKPDGSLAWAQGGICAPCAYRAIDKLALDSHGNLYAAVAALSGMTLGSMEIDSNPLLKFDTSGNLLWARTPDPELRDQVGLPTVAVDAHGNAFVGYRTWASTTFVAKYSPGGDLLWQRRYEALDGSQISGTKVLVDAKGDCLVAAQFFKGKIALGDVLLDTGSLWDGMVAKYTSTGDLKWAIQTQGMYPAGGLGTRSSYIDDVHAALDPSQRIILGGRMGGGAAFGSLALDVPEDGGRLFFARLIDPETARPSIRIASAPDDVQLRWPALIGGFRLESSDSLEKPEWKVVPAEPEMEAEDHVVTIPHSSAQRFFRLQRP